MIERVLGCLESKEASHKCLVMSLKVYYKEQIKVRSVKKDGRGSTRIIELILKQVFSLSGISQVLTNVIG